MPDLSASAELLLLDHGLYVVSTLRPDGSVHSSVVNAGVLTHPLRDEPVVGPVAGGGARYDRVMGDERRAGVLVTPRRVYGNPPS